MTSGRDVDCSESKQASENTSEWGYVVCTVSADGKWEQGRKWFGDLEDAKVKAHEIISFNLVKSVEVWETLREPRNHHERNKPYMKVYELAGYNQPP